MNTSDKLITALVPQIGIRKIIEPTEQVIEVPYTYEYSNEYFRGLNGDWVKPKPMCYKSIWGWVQGLRDGEHI